ncbi:MAG: hypothetical protein WDN45_15720 [Caulobacteraceae bacterium]
MTADLIVNKPLGLSPQGIEFKRAHLYDINPVGVGAMGLSLAVSTLLFTGALAGGPGLLADRRLGRGLRRRPGHRLGDRRQILSGAARHPGHRRQDPGLHRVRNRLRAAGHGFLPGLPGSDLLALLHPGSALP